jgi:hypothetical protein
MSAARTCGMLLAAAAMTVPLAAQPPGPSGTGPERRNLQEEMSKMVDAYLLSHVQDALGLSDEKSAKVVPLILKLQADMRASMERRNDAVADLAKLMESGTATEAQVVERMKLVRSLEVDEPMKLQKDREAIDKELTVVQQAKLRVLEREVRRRVHELARRQRGPMDEPARPPRADKEHPRKKKDAPPGLPPNP